MGGGSEFGECNSSLVEDGNKQSNDASVWSGEPKSLDSKGPSTHIEVGVPALDEASPLPRRYSSFQCYPFTAFRFTWLPPRYSTNIRTSRGDPARLKRLFLHILGSWVSQPKDTYIPIKLELPLRHCKVCLLEVCFYAKTCVGFVLLFLYLYIEGFKDYFCQH
ncbi:unnamed protein product [Protopolystoma xenopodis]|uniref:Uncharacterized protein n=1 Tax=Protopolystoma xenopodis TaxID=117903 RepID=A0A448X995_9PLAT|nr:unnamed protein product [Protopolystoma xenopodis]